MTRNADGPQTALSAPESGETRSPGPLPHDGVRWALYARSGGGDGEAVADQFAFMSASATRFGGEVVACFSDLGRPGDGLLALTQAAAHGRMDRVMVWGLEPLGRQNADLVAALTGLRDHGVRVTLAGTGEEVDGAFVAASVSLEAAGLDAARARAARRRRGEAP